jgi:HupE / UreJ protein
MGAARRWLRAGTVGLALCGALLGMAPAQAHLMAAQKGTLNLVGDAAFLVLSVPVSALQGVDDNGDGGLSTAELQAHADAIRTQVQAGVQLRGSAGPAPLQLMMLDLTPPESAPGAAARHLVVMGRFQLDRPAVQPGAADRPGPEPRSLTFSLFGATAAEQQQDLTITRQTETQWLRFVPERPTHALLPSAAAVLTEYVRTGAAHVLGGPDHWLFLLVVLSAGAGWRSWLGMLTCFTAGHGLTLLACVWGGWSVPAAIVEPAIAATIVGMAAFDGWARRQARRAARPARPGLRLALVFACALIHGLGLAGALSDLTQWAPGSAQLAWALAGFNLGIEAAQIAVAAAAALVVLGLQCLAGPPAQQRAGQFASGVALVAGSFWFVERVAQSV